MHERRPIIGPQEATASQAAADEGAFRFRHRLRKVETFGLYRLVGRQHQLGSGIVDGNLEGNLGGEPAAGT